jgi:hypothetical protein
MYRRKMGYYVYIITA